MNAETTALDLATLAIAILGAVLGVISLGWQVALWRLSGPRVRVRTTYAYLDYSGGVQQGLSVEARNVGREAIEVRGWGLRLPDGRNAVMIRPRRGNPSTPYTLAGGHSTQWFTLFVDMDREQTDVPLAGFVNLGNGETVKGNKITVSAELWHSAQEEGPPGF